MSWNGPEEGDNPTAPSAGPDWSGRAARFGIRAIILVLLFAQGVYAVRFQGNERTIGSGMSDYDEGSLGSAIASFEQAIAVDDRDEDVWASLGDAYLDFYRNPPSKPWSDEDSETILERAWAGYAGAVLRSPLDAWAWSGLADVAIHWTRFENRRTPIDLSEIDENAPRAFDPGHAVALTAAKIALRRQPSGYQQLDVLAKTYAEAGEIDRAGEIYVQSARMFPAPSYHFWGRTRLLEPFYRSILAGLEEGIARSPDFAKTKLDLEVGRFARFQKDLDTALRHFEAARKHTDSPEWLYRVEWEKAGVLEELGRFEEALGALLEAQRYGFDRAQVSRRVGLLQIRLGKFGDACAALRDALRDLASDSALRIETARACEASGENDAAEAVLLEGIGSPVDDLSLSRAIVDFYLRQGRLRTAETVLHAWVRDFPSQGEFQVWAAEVSASRNASPR